jgi:putative tryptophan/tyrosine transport system substrate-binding protein
MTRRRFIAGLGGAAVWPLAARAQQGERVRRLALLWSRDEGDPLQRMMATVLTGVLAERGWVEGRTLRIISRGNPELPR